MRVEVFILASLALSGCATSTKMKVLSSMAGAAALGGIYGLSRPEAKSQNALLWAGVGSAVAGAVAVSLSDPDKEAERLRQETIRLREELEMLNSPRVEKQTTGLFGAKVPEKYRSLINPGEWRVSRIDQWIEDDENRLIHQDLVMELIPPSLNPISRPTNQKEKAK